LHPPLLFSSLRSPLRLDKSHAVQCHRDVLSFDGIQIYTSLVYATRPSPTLHFRFMSLMPEIEYWWWHKVYIIIIILYYTYVRNNFESNPTYFSHKNSSKNYILRVPFKNLNRVDVVFMILFTNRDLTLIIIIILSRKKFIMNALRLLTGNRSVICLLYIILFYYNRYSRVWKIDFASKIFSDSFFLRRRRSSWRIRILYGF